MAATAEQETPLQLNLYDEAKDTAIELAQRHGVSEADVVARALGTFWILDNEKRKKHRTFVEDDDGELCPINITVKAGDATS